MKLSIKQNDIIGKTDFTETLAKNIFLNAKENEVAVIKKDHAIVLQDDEEPKEIENLMNGVFYNPQIGTKLIQIVIEAIENDYELLDFFDEVTKSVICALMGGYIFKDYLYNRNLVESDKLLELCGINDWEKMVKTACERSGLNYDEEIKAVETVNDKLNKEIEKAFVNKEIVVDVTMEDLYERALRGDDDISKN